MTRIEEKLYLQSVFDAIDEVYNLKNRQKSSTYEERLRASFSKLIIPDWYNPDYTSTNELRKTKSYGQVTRLKLYDFPNNEIPNGSILSLSNSTHLSNGIHQQRSPSRSRSERASLRRNSTASSCDTNGSITTHGRRLTNSNGTSTYAPGMQRVAETSTWYKPKTFTRTITNGHSDQYPQPLPRSLKINHERQNPTKSFSNSLSSATSIIPNSNSDEQIRHPIKPRTMTQPPIPTNESTFLDASSDFSFDTLTSSSRATDGPSLYVNHALPTPHSVINTTSINLPMTSNISRNDSSKSVSSEVESYTSAVLPTIEKNLLATDSSSYASVNDQCISTSSSSYHTAIAGDGSSSSSSSMTGYETPTPQLDDETLSSHSSISDLSHAETLEPNVEDLDIVAVSTGEQKAAIIPSVDVGMENLPLPPFPSTLPNTSSSSTSDNSPSTESRPNWYDDGSTATCIDQTSPLTPHRELREISDDQLLHEVDIGGVNDEFFLFSSTDTNDDQSTDSIVDEKQESIEGPLQTPKRIYTVENEIFNDDLGIMDDFHCSSTVDPFGSNHNNNNSTIMITNLDDILIDDEDDEQQVKEPLNYLLNINYRRPIQEDILYEVEHENSYSDHSQNTSSIVMLDNNTSIKNDPNLECLTTTVVTEEPTSPAKDVIQQPMTSEASSSSSLSSVKKSDSNEINSSLKQTSNDNQTLPIYILPPTYTTATTTTGNSSTLHIDTNSNPSTYTWNSSLQYYLDPPTLSSPSSSYTSKIRQRHYSVGSYYDNKTTTVALHPNNTLYIIGSAPVSPISRTSTTSSESHYHVVHHSPVSYGNVSFNALRRINPFIETNTFTSSYDYPPSTSVNRTDYYHVIPPALIPSQPFTQSNSETFPRNDTSVAPPKTSSISPPSRLLPAPSSTHFEREEPLIRPKTSRGRSSENSTIPPPTPPPRSDLIERNQAENIYQEIESASTDDDQPSTTRSADLRFIRGTIERVFEFHDESTSEISTNGDEISTDNKNENKSTSISNSSNTVSKKTNQYPAVEAVQRFYDTKSPSVSEKKKQTHQLTTNLDDLPTSNNSSSSASLFARSHPVNHPEKDLSKSSDNEQASSEEIDDTLNDIEDEDSQDEKFKRQAANGGSRTSNESSPSHSSDNQINAKKTSQETQTLQRKNPVIANTRSPSSSQSTVQSYETARSIIPPLDIVTQMVIERNDSVDDGRITEICGDMVIFYDDIEIVEHSSEISSTESESRSSISKSLPKSRPVQTRIESVPPPPIPARTLKPLHLLNNQQESPSTSRTQQAIPPATPSKTNRTYELEKSNVRRKFNVNSVNDTLNRSDNPFVPTVSHRHPSARHFVGKLNSDETSSRKSSTNGSYSPVKVLPTKTTMTKSQTLPSQPITITNGHTKNSAPQSPIKNSSATLPIRSTSTIGTNGKHCSTLADTNALVKQIQNSLSRNSLHDSHLHSPLSISTKDFRTFVSSTYSPDENTIDDEGIVHCRQRISSQHDEQAFQRQARLSKSFHNVSEYNSTDQYPKKENHLNSRALPSKSVENNLNHVSQNSHRNSQIPINFPPIAASTSFSALPHSEDHARLLSMKWYTGQVSENSEICYNTPHTNHDDLLFGYISRHSNRETQLLLSRLQTSNDIRIHAALDDIRLRIGQFDASKSQEELPIFMRYLESRLRDINNKNPTSSATTSTHSNGQRRMSNGGTSNGYSRQPQSDTISIKSRTSSIVTGTGKETPSLRQLGRQHLRSTGNITTTTTGGGGGINGHHAPLPPPRRASQSSSNQENPAVFDDMLNTVLGLPKKGTTILPQTQSSNRDRSIPLTPTQIITNPTTPNKQGRDVGKRLFESGTYKDPRLLYDGPRKTEKEEQPLETSV